MLETVYVTDHAQLRWRERSHAASYDILEYFHKARRIGNNEPIHLKKLPNSHYYFSDELQLYFVVQPVDKTTGRIITVMEIPEGAKVFAEPGTITESEKQSIEEQWAEYNRRLKDIQCQLGVLNKASPKRQKLLGQLKILQEEMAVFKPIYQESRQRELQEQDNIFLPNGLINHSAAISYLIGEVETLKEKIRQLETVKNTVVEKPVQPQKGWFRSLFSKRDQLPIPPKEK